MLAELSLGALSVALESEASSLSVTEVDTVPSTGVGTASRDGASAGGGSDASAEAAGPEAAEAEGVWARTRLRLIKLQDCAIHVGWDQQLPFLLTCQEFRSKIFEFTARAAVRMALQEWLTVCVTALTAPRPSSIRTDIAA